MCGEVWEYWDLKFEKYFTGLFNSQTWSSRSGVYQLSLNEALRPGPAITAHVSSSYWSSGFCPDTHLMATDVNIHWLDQMRTRE